METLDCCEIKSTFVGMGKEELMKYANDPFWVRLRWFFFILFWLLWIGMLIGAIMIIIAAPKCAPPEPRTWWEQGPLTEVQADRTLEELQEMKSNGIQGIIVPWKEDVYKTALNLSEDFLTFMKNANASEMKVIIELAPVSTDKWFERSEGKDDDFIDYYIWKDKKSDDLSSIDPTPPNNWLRPDNKPAWNYSKARDQFYLTWDNKPQLNFRNPKVINELSKVIHRFLDAGVEGIRLKGAPSLLVDPLFENDGISGLSGYNLDEYMFYTHTKTLNLQGLGPLLKQWRKIVKNKTENGPFFISDELSTIEPYKVNGSLVIDLPKHSRVFSNVKNLNATLLKHILDSAFIILEDNWPLWERAQNNLPVDVMDFITFLLPGVTVVDNNHKVDKELLNLRKSPSVMYGNFTRYLVANNTVFAFIRVAAGNPGYLVAVNPTAETINVNFLKDINILSEEVTVQLLSKNYNETGIDIKLKAEAKSINMSPNSAMVLTYVPKEK